MTDEIKLRDWEALSTYLDGQMSAKERKRLESRLQASAELRAGLVELKRTRDILRSQSKVRAPRNFTLSAQMVGLRQASPAYPAMRLAAVLASLLLVLVVVGDWFSSTTSFGLPLFTQATREVQLEMVVTDEFLAQMGEVTPEMEALEIEPMEAPAEEVLRGPLAPLTADQAQETVQAEEAETEEAAAAMKVLPTQPPPALGSELAEESTFEAAGEAPSALVLQSTPTSILEVLPEATPVMEPEAEQGRDLIRSIEISPIRGFEIFLALVALVTGIVALILRRR